MKGQLKAKVKGEAFEGGTLSFTEKEVSLKPARAISVEV